VKRVHRLWERLERAGIRPERLQLEWISAAEGQKFATAMRRMEELRRSVTAEEIKHGEEALRPKKAEAGESGQPAGKTSGETAGEAPRETAGKGSTGE
jgi:heterodisulfide reductase subunit A